MACINADGTVTASALALLRAAGQRGTTEQIAQATGLPLFKVRSGLRELVQAGLVTLDTSGLFALTEAGGKRLEQQHEAVTGL